MKITRQKEQDEYDSKKSQLERELADKKEKFEQEISLCNLNLKNTEAELHELRKNSAEFSAELEKALRDKEIKIHKQLKTQYDFNVQPMEKQNEADIHMK